MEKSIRIFKEWMQARSKFGELDRDSRWNTETAVSHILALNNQENDK